jgi:putative ABC transport system permease protein
METRLIQIVLQDLRYALRQLRRNPGFALVAVATLALGIGVNTAVFSIFDQVMLRKLPVRDPGALVLLSEHSEAESGGLHSHGDNKLYFSYPGYRALQAHSPAFAGVLGSAPIMLAIAGQDHTEQAWAEIVSGNYFDVLGMRPALGRLLTPADDAQRAGNPFTVLSYAYWQSRFGGNPAIVDTTIHLNGQPFQVVGVAAPGYTGLSPEETPALFVPLAMEAALSGRKDFLEDPNQRWMNVLARLKPGTPLAQAEAAMASTWRSIRQSALERIHHRSPHFDEQYMDSHLFVRSGGQGLPMLRDDFGAPLTALMGMVLAVLLIACGNVANLLLVRGAGRRREIAVRSALGATPGQLFRQSLLEGLVLGAVAAVLGAALGQAGAHLLIGSFPAETELTGALSAHL